MRMKIEAEGVDAVLGQLRALDRKVRKKVIRKATSAAAKLIHKEARRLSPRNNGFLRMSLIVVIRSGKSVIFARIGQEKNKKFKRKRFKGSNINRRGYAVPLHWIEDGTKSHRIAASGKALSWTAGKRKGSKGRAVFAKSVRHPGTRPGKLLERSGRLASPAAGRAFLDIARDEMAKIPRPGEVVQ